MVVLDGNFALGSVPGMVERTGAIKNEVPTPITLVLAYPTVFTSYFP
jgi:hypothetical protein